MSKTQLGLLFSAGLVVWVIANGLLPLLPVYSLQLGADVGFTGGFLSFSFLMLAVSTMLTGWLADRYQRRKAMFIGAGIFHSLTLVLMSQATNHLQFAIYLSLEWFCFGMGIALIIIFAGLSAREEERGKVFGILSVSGGFGLLIGGLLLGQIADTCGYPTLLCVLAVFSLIWPILGLFLQDKRVVRSTDEQTSQRKRLIDIRLWLFLGSFTVAWIGFFVGRFGTSVAMESLGFASVEIASTAAVAGAVTLPLPLALGWFSDRAGRLKIIAVGFFLSTIGLGILTLASDLWQFWLVAVLITMVSAVIGVGTAYITDTVPQGSIGIGLSLFQSTSWVGGIVAFVVAGNAIERIGFEPSIAIGALLSLAALGILVLSRRPRTAAIVSTAAGS